MPNQKTNTPTLEETDRVETCKICGAELEWVDCWNGCDDGFFDGYEEDPLWYDPGDLIPCSACRGNGGYLECPNLPHENQARG